MTSISQRYLTRLELNTDLATLQMTSSVAGLIVSNVLPLLARTNALSMNNFVYLISSFMFSPLRSSAWQRQRRQMRKRRPIKTCSPRLATKQVFNFFVYSSLFCPNNSVIQCDCLVKCVPGNVADSVTRLGDLLDFGQLFKAFGNNYFVQIAHILRQFLQSCQNL